MPIDEQHNEKDSHQKKKKKKNIIKQTRKTQQK